MRDRKTNSVVLAPWRLKRAVEFIEMNLATPLQLVEIARAAGLSGARIFQSLLNAPSRRKVSLQCIRSGM
ncbi:hypothetical protein ASE47_36385 [Ensifer sp. Root258]|nr:hypothetical protein ASE47_36385 [Ensifer sp. Root258]